MPFKHTLSIYITSVHLYTPNTVHPRPQPRQHALWPHCCPNGVSNSLYRRVVVCTEKKKFLFTTLLYCCCCSMQSKGILGLLLLCGVICLFMYLSLFSLFRHIWSKLVVAINGLRCNWIHYYLRTYVLM